MRRTYISLFSSAGVGCYGFKLEGFDCVATNELIERRLDVQKFNNKCKYDSGYLCGDVTKQETKEKLYAQIELWKRKEGLKQVDVVIATPPCQGMSVANHKKNDTEIIRNSLVVESIKIIKEIRPKFFLFENVPAFMRTVCTDIDGYDKPIEDAIHENLGSDYVYVSKVINFKNYGACSSRTRTVVIGVQKSLADEISPFELYPELRKELTLREVIGGQKPLTIMGEIDESDIYHFFRSYPGYMREWIHDLKEGESAFDNEDDCKKPHQIVDGQIVINKQKNADKYTRQFWDKVGPCVHTRNDQLASQNTIHPSDDRVFSVRELMLMMTVPSSFKWSENDLDTLNRMTYVQKIQYLKKEEIKIRQSLGEAVPTTIFRQIASNIKAFLDSKTKTNAQIIKYVAERGIESTNQILELIRKNDDGYSLTTLGKMAELSNTNRTDEAAYFTSKALITEMMKKLPVIENDSVRILEPSVGVGNFIPLIIKKFEGKKITIDAMDIDENSLLICKEIMGKHNFPETVIINYIHDDFLTHDFTGKYDYVIGNPPFYKISSKEPLYKRYKESAINRETKNVCSFFLDKAIAISNYVSLVLPKFILNTPEFDISRDYLSRKSINCIIDFGENGFPGVLIETVALFVNNNGKPKCTNVVSISKNKDLVQQQDYIFDKALPYWIIYRDGSFDRVLEKMELDVFTVFRDRQLTNQVLKPKGQIRVVKSRNIDDRGTAIIDIAGYDSFVDEKDISNLAVYRFLDDDSVFLTPNMTYNPRVMKKPKNTVVNGSVAILIPKRLLSISDKQLLFFSSEEYRSFYQIARNYQTRSLNVDSRSVYFYGLLKDEA